MAHISTLFAFHVHAFGALLLVSPGPLNPEPCGMPAAPG